MSPIFDPAIFDPAIFDAGTHGKTAELAVCAPLRQDMQCFPLTLTQSGFPRIARSLGGRPLPMSHALDGRSGEMFTQDYRGRNVVAVHTPLGTLGPGMVLKIDRDELFGPVKQRLRVIVPLLAPGSGWHAAAANLGHWQKRLPAWSGISDSIGT